MSSLLDKFTLTALKLFSHKRHSWTLDEISIKKCKSLRYLSFYELSNETLAEEIIHSLWDTLNA